MKHTDDSPGLTPHAVAAALKAAGVTVSRDQADLLVRHAELVLMANARMNLTRITTPADVLALHVVDSLAFLPQIAPLGGRLIDIGSGAGFPGLPLAILGLDVMLCESVKKKAAFLEEAVRELGLDVPVSPLRAEELATTAAGNADVVTARAVSSTGALIELASPLLAPHGRLIALKGTPGPDELAAAARTAALCGMKEVSVVHYSLPSLAHRTVLVFEKVGRARVGLPRRPGQAQRQPLSG